ncbi:MAG: class I SAM-dependent methyltransferase [Anaerolineae bacterium]|nr:class I SAM-dependent methyltransferase [Anaerolineae bacterium]
MEPSEYHAIRRIEDHHWWYAGMRAITTALLESLYPGRRDLRILDAGCGTGGAMAHLARFGRVTGCDLSALALELARTRGLTEFGQASVTALPFAPASFDLVTSFDVLYHRAVGDPRVALRQFRRVLLPGGRVLLRLPALDWLRGGHDVAVHTARRFTTGSVAAALGDTGFAVERLTYANSLLLPVAVARRLLDRVTPGGLPARSDVTHHPAWLDALLRQPLALEARWLRRRRLAWGLTVVAVGRAV